MRVIHIYDNVIIHYMLSDGHWPKVIKLYLTWQWKESFQKFSIVLQQSAVFRTIINSVTKRGILSDRKRVLFIFLFMFCLSFCLCFVSLSVYVLFLFLFMFCFSFCLCFVSLSVYVLFLFLFMFCFSFCLCFVSLYVSLSVYVSLSLSVWPSVQTNNSHYERMCS
jgi:hypothetical protein